MRRFVLALLALTVLLPSLAEARARWMSDVELYVRDTCCTMPMKARRAPALPALEKLCCRVEKQGATGLPLASESVTSPATAPVATRISIVPVAPPLHAVVATIVPRAQAPPPLTLLAQARGLLL